MEFLTHLFESAKNAVISTANNFIGKAKKSIAQTVVDQFGDEIIDAGKSFVTKKLTDAFDETVQDLSFSTISQKLAADSLKGMKALEEQFNGLLDNAETELDHIERDDNNPLVNGAIRLASSLLSKGKTFSKELSKLTQDNIKEFRRDINRAIPDLQKNLSESFVNLFIKPILNFLADLLRSLFKPQQQMIGTATPIGTASPNANATTVVTEQNDVEHDENYRTTFTA